MDERSNRRNSCVFKFLGVIWTGLYLNVFLKDREAHNGTVIKFMNTRNSDKVGVFIKSLSDKEVHSASVHRGFTA